MGIVYTCWYCIHAFRENSSTVSCNKKWCQFARTHGTCEHFLRDPKKEYAGDEVLKI